MMKNNNLKVILFSTCLLVAGSPVIADDGEGTEGKEKINPWQQCGIGAGIFSENKTAAAISNVIWDSGTTAVTSATASPDTCSSKTIETARFIDETYDVLAQETAMGEGKHLSAAINLIGCQPAAQQQVTAMLRQDLQGLIDHVDYNNLERSQKAYSYYSSLVDAAASTKGCLSS